MRATILGALFALSLNVPGALAVAQTTMPPMAMPQTAKAQPALVNGDVRKIDEAAGKITLHHGPIKNLGMDDASMTMVFPVQDPAMLKQVKVGDRVQFQADDVNGQITVTKIQKAKP